MMVTGLGARDADRLALASRFGADLAVEVSADDLVVELTKAAGALADVVVDVTAYRAALDLLASGRRPFASLPRRCMGLDDAEDLLGVRDWRAYQTFGPAERAVLAATDDVVRDSAVSAESWAACEREFGADKAVLIELVTTIGAWRMVASILHSLQVPLEDGVASWPPEGLAP
jgi:hypothetical protein